MSSNSIFQLPKCSELSFNTKAKIIELLNSSDVPKTTSEAYHDENLKQLLQENTTVDTPKAFFVSYVKGNEKTIQLNNKTDHTAALVAAPYRLMYHYTYNNKNLPPTLWVLEQNNDAVTINLSKLQTEIASSPDPFTKLAAMRHAMVTYYVLSNHNKMQLVEEVEETKKDKNKVAIMEMKSREKVELASIKAQVYNTYLLSEQGRRGQGQDGLKTVLKSIDKNKKEGLEPPQASLNEKDKNAYKNACTNLNWNNIEKNGLPKTTSKRLQKYRPYAFFKRVINPQAAKKMTAFQILKWKNAVLYDNKAFKDTYETINDLPLQLIIQVAGLHFDNSSKTRLFREKSNRTTSFIEKDSISLFRGYIQDYVRRNIAYEKDWEKVQEFPKLKDVYGISSTKIAAFAKNKITQLLDEQIERTAFFLRGKNIKVVYEYLNQCKEPFTNRQKKDIYEFSKNDQPKEDDNIVSKKQLELLKKVEQYVSYNELKALKKARVDNKMEIEDAEAQVEADEAEVGAEVKEEELQLTEEEKQIILERREAKKNELREQETLESVESIVNDINQRGSYDGIVDYLFNTYGKQTLDSFIRGIKQYIAFGQIMQMENDQRDFYNSTYLDFFQHMQDKLMTFNRFNYTTRYEYYINEEEYERDRKVFESVTENIDQMDLSNDLKNLISRKTMINWHSITRIALYEKYNFFLPEIETYFGESQWKSLCDTRAFDDFLYAYSLLFTIIFNDNKDIFGFRKDL